MPLEKGQGAAVTVIGEEVRLSDAARLALACASGCGDGLVRAAAEGIADEDWPAAVALYDYHFVAPVVLARLRSSLPQPHNDRLDVLARSVLGAARRSLMLQATMRSLRNDHLGPLSIRFVVLKGLALGARYYGDPALRTTRDVDILVERADVERLLQSLVGAGYRPLDRHALGRPGISTLEQAVAMANLSKEVVLVSPQGIPVEVHHSLEPTGRTFPTPAVFERAERVEIWQEDWLVPATADLVPYIAFHHAHHRWSRLHWLMDLTMIMRHPAFDRDKALRHADGFGVRAVTEAAMDMPAHVAAAVEGVVSAPVPALTGEFAAECVAGLVAGAGEVTGARRSGRAQVGDLAADYRRRWMLHDRPGPKLRTLLEPVSPKIADYLALPLPPKRHWIYWVTRPVRLALRRGRS